MTLIGSFADAATKTANHGQLDIDMTEIQLFKPIVFTLPPQDYYGHVQS